MMKKTLSVILALLVMIGTVTCLPMTASAAERISTSDEAEPESVVQKDNADLAESGYAFPPLWHELYRRFVLNKNYLTYVNSFFKDQRHVFFLYDIDSNGIPELFVNTGYAAVSYQHEVFTVRNNSVVHLESKALGGSFDGYAPYSSYTGFFSSIAHTGSCNYTYHYIQDNEWRSEFVANYLEDHSATPIKYQLKSKTDNSELYNAFISATKAQTSGLRSFLYQGKSYGLDEINSMGWDTFVSKYPYLSVPKLTSTTNVYGGVCVKWNAVIGADQYRVFRKTANGSWANVADTFNTEYTDKTAQSGTKYTYTVRCLSSNGEYYTSLFDRSGKAVTYISAPIISKRQNATNGIRLAWNAVQGAGKYRVFIKSGSSWKKLADTAATSYVYSRAQSGTAYTFTARCITADGKKFISAYNQNGWKVTFIATPKATRIENTTTGVKLTWGKITGAVKYRVFVKNGSGWKQLGDTTATSYTHKAAASGTTYTYTVRCVSSDGKTYHSAYNSKGWSIKYIAAPAISKRQNVTNGIRLVWNAVKGAAKYRVFIKSGTGWKTLADTTATSYVYTGAKSGTAYTFTVRCITADGKKFASAYNTAGWKVTFVATPKVTKIESTKSGVKLTWGKITGAGKYRVFVKTSSGWSALGDTAATTYTHTAAKEGTKYTYTLRCVTSDGKAYQSAFNSAGWSITFKKPVDWSGLYKTFVLNKQYLTMIGNNSYFTYRTDNAYNQPDFRLYDFNKDGIPELIGYTGISQFSRHYLMHVYTVKNNKVTYVSMMDSCGKTLGYYPNSGYPGLFSSGGQTGVYNANYCYMKDNEIVGKQFASSAYKDFRNPDLGLNTAYEDKGLYNAFLACTTGSDKSVLRNVKYPLPSYTYAQIQAMGWNSFVSRYGY